MTLCFPTLNVSEEKALKLLKLVLLLSSFALFLPYAVVSSVFGIAALLFLFIRPFRERILISFGTKIAFAFLTVTATVALINGNYVGFIRTLVFFAALIVMFVARTYITRDFFEKLLDVICLGGCFSSVYALVEKIVLRNKPDYRCMAFFTNPNFLGIALVLVVFICAFKAATHAPHTIVYYIVAIINALGIYLCGSTSLWAVVAIGILFILLFTHEYRLLAIFLSVIVLGIIAAFFVPGVMPRIKEFSMSIGTRKTVWSLAMENFRDAPIFGRGFHTFKFLYDRYHDSFYFYHASMSHNIWLDGFLCHGIVGMSLVLATFGRFFYSLNVCRKQRRLVDKRSPLCGFIVAVTIALLCYGTIDTTFIWIQSGTILLIIATGLGAEENELKATLNKINCDN